MRRRGAYGKLIPVLIACFLLTGAFSLAPVTVTMDPDKDPLYRVVTVDALEGALAENKAAAMVTYEKQLLAVCGIMGSMEDKGNAFMMTGSESAEAIRCTVSDAKLRVQAAGLAPGSAVCVMGKMKLSALPEARWTLSVDAVAPMTGNAPSGECWRDASGTIIRTSDRAEKGFGADRIRGGARVTALIPRSFLSVEEELPDTEGFLYRLNELPGERKAQPEQLYLFFFDNETMLQDQNDIRRTTKIEEAIIQNILPGESIAFGKFPKRHNAYGRPFQYYDTAYDGYHAEFAFTPAGEDGIFCMLYIYRSSDHLKDILSVFRFLEIAQ